eukprot:TRINITY_DN1524_c0_g1_i1.p1 TRINITY_DN1524_c0_g1~~TRINITY_DN1524_c0_g1_i1.p1  ORF type:complete len:917 (+),score=162.01 TRINITY_DN1524_c0_g1_i1:378-3128(+)
MANPKDTERINKDVPELAQAEVHSSESQGLENPGLVSGLCCRGKSSAHPHSIEQAANGYACEKQEPFPRSETVIGSAIHSGLQTSSSRAKLERGNILLTSQVQAHQFSLGVSDSFPVARRSVREPNRQPLGSGERENVVENVFRSSFSDSNRNNQMTIAHRLREVLQGTGSGDLLLQQSERENGMLQWLQALDLQVTGACRADERLRPMLQLNVSCTGADDKLLAQLSQHFKARELGMLARCLCVPLISMRVGKVLKRGHLFYPTSIRGHLSLTLLPSSDLRLSFVGLDGYVERLATLSPGNENSNVVIEEIPADASGRSFLIRLPGSKVLPFWQSEKSKLVGDELLTKMKDLLGQRPSLAELTGIRESRLDSFATHLRATFLGSSNSEITSNTVSNNLSTHSMRSSQRSKLASSHSSNQGSLSPRGSNFKDGPSRNISFVRTVSSAREKIKRYMDANSFSIIGSESFITEQTSDNLHNCRNKTPGSGTSEVPVFLSGINQVEITGCNTSHVFKPERYVHLPSSVNNTSPFQPSHTSSEPLFNPLPVVSLPVSSCLPLVDSSIFSPYYCPCPLRPSTLQYTITPPFLPSLSTEAVSLPPASSFLSGGSSSPFIPSLPLDLHNVSFTSLSLPVPSLVNIPASLQTSDLPSLLSNPVVNVPLPVSSFVTVPTPQKITSFTPFFSDPIVHIPVSDFHSTGQGFLVSAGPSISTAISPILPGLLSTLIPEPSNAKAKEDDQAMQLLASLDFSSPWMKSEPDICHSTSVTSPSGDHMHDGIMPNIMKKDGFVSDDVNILHTCLDDSFSKRMQQKEQLSDGTSSVLVNPSIPRIYGADLDVRPNISGLVTGSRGLYGGPCDPVVSSNLVSGVRQKANAAHIISSVHERNKSRVVVDIDGLPSLDVSTSDEEIQPSKPGASHS